MLTPVNLISGEAQSKDGYLELREVGDGCGSARGATRGNYLGKPADAVDVSTVAPPSELDHLERDN